MYILQGFDAGDTTITSVRAFAAVQVKIPANCFPKILHLTTNLLSRIDTRCIPF